MNLSTQAKHVPIVFIVDLRSVASQEGSTLLPITKEQSLNTSPASHGGGQQ